jgi:hypothetical protein
LAVGLGGLERTWSETVIVSYTPVEDGRHDMSSFISDQQSMASSASQLRLRRALIVLLAIFVVFYFLWPSRASSVVATSAGAGAGGSSGGVPRPQNAQRPQQAWTEQELREWDNLDVIKNETLGV